MKCPNCGKTIEWVNLYYFVRQEVKMDGEKLEKDWRQVAVDFDCMSDKPTEAECECGEDIMPLLDKAEAF